MLRCLLFEMMIEMGDCYKQSVSIWLLRGTKIFNKKIFRCFIEIIFISTQVICLSLVWSIPQKMRRFGKIESELF